MFLYFLGFSACVGLLSTAYFHFGTEFGVSLGFMISWMSIMILGLFYSKFLFSMCVTMDIELFNSIDKLKKEIVKSKENKSSYLQKLSKASDMLNPRSRLEKVVIMIAFIFNPKSISFYKNTSHTRDTYFKYRDTQGVFIVKIAPAFILVTCSACLILEFVGNYMI